jgi:hypothetical protein
MSHTLIDILSYSIAFAAIIGLVRIKQIDQVYFPFLLLIWLGLLNEIVSTLTIKYFRTNAESSNIYMLAESLLILWFFKRLGLFTSKKILFYVVGSTFIGGWIVDNFIISSIHAFSSYFGILYSFFIVLMSINIINKLIVEERKRLYRNPVFLIMIGFISFFTYKILIEIFWVYGLNSTDEFRTEVYRIMTFINLLVNLIYALALIWIPRKQEYTLQ